MTQQHTANAQTNVTELVADLDAGQFERKLGIALSQVAAAVVDNGRQGEITVKMKFTAIPNTHQVRCDHHIEFKRPTTTGVAGEKDMCSTVLYVGQFGRLSLAQPPLKGMQGELTERSGG